jgi:hypothetical protein
MSSDDGKHKVVVLGSEPRKVVALGTEPNQEVLRAARRAVREPEIRTERGFARHHDVIITEAYDDAEGKSHVRHAGEDPDLHRVVLTERAHGQRHRVSEEQRSRRMLAALACVLVLGSAAILAFAPEGTNVYLGTAVLLAAAGAFGIKAFRVKVRDFELDVGK